MYVFDARINGARVEGGSEMEQPAGMTAELYKAVVAVVDDRVGEIKVTRQDFDDLKGVVEERASGLERAMEKLAQAQARTDASLKELAQAQARTDASLKELAQAQARTEERVGGLERAMEKLAQAQTRTESSLRELAQQVGRLSENIGFGLEDVARVVLPGYLAYRHNLQLEGEPGEELRRVFFEVDGGEVEINLYGEGRRDGQRAVVLGESKSRIYGREVRDFAEVLAQVEPLVEGEVVRVMFGFYINPTALREAREKGILLVASYQHRTELNLRP